MNAFEAFAALIEPRRDGTLPLLKTLAELPRYAHADVDPDAVIACVQRWREQMRERVAADTSTLNRLRLLNHFFFDELGFRGDPDAYDSADASYLHRVIEQRRGIPISLALLYTEIGRAIGLKLSGVAFPGHFIVRLQLAEGALLIDVFGGGVTLSDRELRQRQDAVTRGRSRHPLESYLQPAGDRAILARWLRNLKAVHARREDWPALLEVMNRLILLLPREPGERRDRAAVFQRLECPRGAADDLASYLSLAGDAPDAGEMRRRLTQLQHAVQRLN
jgi:regulator of sirC expression with transglutaminase-like and TPR domain